jgi:DNA-binding NarL/FixJ family response regulator
MGEPLRVVLADDHFLVRDGLAALLRNAPDVTVVAAVADGPALVEAVASERPNAVLTDIRMPPGHATDGITAALQIRERWPDTGVVVLSQHLEHSYVQALFARGSEGLGYLLKERVGQRDELVDALTRTARGESVLDRKVVDLLVGGPHVDELAALSEREREVLAQMAAGLTNPAIAARLFLSLSTVEKHVASIFTKLHLGDEPDVNRRVAAVLAWVERQPHRDRAEWPGDD